MPTPTEITNTLLGLSAQLDQVAAALQANTNTVGDLAVGVAQAAAEIDPDPTATLQDQIDDLIALLANADGVAAARLAERDDALAQVADLTTQLAAVTTERDDALTQIGELYATIAQLEAIIAVLQEQPHPVPGESYLRLPPTSVFSFPGGADNAAHENPEQYAMALYRGDLTSLPTPGYAQTKGCAPYELAAGVLTARIDVANGFDTWTCGSHENYVHLPSWPAATLHMQAGHVDHDGVTAAFGGQNKFGGLAIWRGPFVADGWGWFPGGNRGSNADGSFRWNIWNYWLPSEANYNPNQARHTAYLYLPTAGISAIDTHGLAAYPRPVELGTNIEVLSNAFAVPGAVYDMRAEMVAGTVGHNDGSLRMWIDGELEVELTGIMWAEVAPPVDGWAYGVNTATTSIMCGGAGRTPGDIDRWAPRNAQRASHVRVERFDVDELVAA